MASSNYRRRLQHSSFDVNNTTTDNTDDALKQARRIQRVQRKCEQLASEIYRIINTNHHSAGGGGHNTAKKKSCCSSVLSSSTTLLMSAAKRLQRKRERLLRKFQQEAVVRLATPISITPNFTSSNNRSPAATNNDNKFLPSSSSSSGGSNSVAAARSAAPKSNCGSSSGSSVAAPAADGERGSTEPRDEDLPRKIFKMLLREAAHLSLPFIGKRMLFGAHSLMALLNTKSSLIRMASAVTSIRTDNNTKKENEADDESNDEEEDSNLVDIKLAKKLFDALKQGDCGRLARQSENNKKQLSIRLLQQIKLYLMVSRRLSAYKKRISAATAVVSAVPRKSKVRAAAQKPSELPVQCNVVSSTTTNHTRARKNKKNNDDEDRFSVVSMCETVIGTTTPTPTSSAGVEKTVAVSAAVVVTPPAARVGVAAPAAATAAGTTNAEIKVKPDCSLEITKSSVATDETSASVTEIPATIDDNCEIETDNNNNNNLADVVEIDCDFSTLD